MDALSVMNAFPQITEFCREQPCPHESRFCSSYRSSTSRVSIAINVAEPEGAYTTGTLMDPTSLHPSFQMGRRGRPLP
jgi:hypothetical protein